MEKIIPSHLTIRAYENTSRKVMGLLKLLERFAQWRQLWNSNYNYNLFLGWAWLHPIGAIPSSLHQKMKIPWKGRITILLGDGEILAPACGLEKEESELLMSGFEFVNMAN